MFCNVMHVYVCKIGEERFGVCWWSFSCVDQPNPVVVSTLRTLSG